MPALVGKNLFQSKSQPQSNFSRRANNAILSAAPRKNASFALRESVLRRLSKPKHGSTVI